MAPVIVRWELVIRLEALHSEHLLSLCSALGLKLVAIAF